MAQVQHSGFNAPRAGPVWWSLPRSPQPKRPKRQGKTAALRGLILLSLAIALTGPSCQKARAQETPGNIAPSTNGSSRFDAASDDRLIQQKLRLLKTYLGAVNDGRLAETENPEVEVLVAEARAHVAAAEKALAEGDLARSAALTDLGLRSMGRASAAAGQAKPRPGAAPNRERLAVLRRQIEGYLTTLRALLQQPALQSAHGPALQRIENLLERTAELESRGAYAEAGALLAEAYPITLKVVSELHQGRTLVARLEFAGPEEEFSYEQKRYESYELLVSLARQEQSNTARITDDSMTSRFLAAARTLRDQAAAEAQRGDFESSIRTMEQATKQLVYALRASGVEILY